ncbi:TPA: hypothetical protein PXR55_003062 [Yersinia enterocolitica]|nr:hypothetical protein [Yersinia enterocolitica]HDL6983967.1 hypothetical protein [Yersinia enterocolitica]HDL7063874.1 hypothetical protein [Yersinia enterocolitica]HDL7067961.1 hypothetical protein [Yersinia enterocolitica]HDL7068255.1 hypothetical protein [Yersinia enterocolitica]
MMNGTKSNSLDVRIKAAEQVINHFSSPYQAAKALECSYEAIKTYRKRGLPEKVALLCHMSIDIPYTYNPADYGRNPENLSLVLTKPAHQ